MKTKILSILLVSSLIFSVSCINKKGIIDPKTMILPLGDTVHLRDGSLIYGLPLTVFDIEVDIEKRIEKQGPYAKYANDLLGIKDIITQDREIWSITGVRVNSNTEIDPAELFVIESNSLFQTNMLSLKKAGLVLDINPDIFEKSSDLSIAGRSTNYGKGFFDMGSDEYFVNQSDTAFRLVKLDTAFIRIPYLVEKKKQLTLDQLAERAAKSLLELRDGKHLILTGEANVFPQSNAPIEEMNRLENEYLALFAGKTWTESKTIKYSFIPQKDMPGKSVPLFRFSPQNGLTDQGSNTGTQVNIQFMQIQKINDPKIITYPKPPDGTAPKYDKLYYRMPRVIAVSVKMGDENLYNSRKLVYQLGNVMQLPANYIIGR
jgi:hypothetical protein